MSSQLRANLGPVVAMLPMPLTEASVESVEPTPTGYLAVLRLVGGSNAIRLTTRWKDRDGRPTIVEVSHLPDAPPPAPPAEGEPTTDEQG